jgi:hypothetical protein
MRVSGALQPSGTPYQGWSGTANPLLLDAAYQTAIMTQALAHTELSHAQAIAQAYGEQRMSQELSQHDS